MAEPILVSGGLENRNRRVIVLGGVAVALILAVVVLPGVLFGGGGTDEPVPPPVFGTPTTLPGQAPAETFEVFSDKNPFQPLVATGPSAEPQPAPPPAATADTVPAPLVPDPVADPGSPAAGAPPPGDAPAPTTETTAPARQPDRVSLLQVFIDPSGRVVASVRVNDVTYEVVEGDEFAASYRMLDIDSSTRCAEMLFGDDRFGLCEGEEALK